MSDAVIVKGTTVSKEGVSFQTPGKSIVVVADIQSGDGDLVVTISGVTSSGYKYQLLVSDTLTGVGTTPLRIFPGATPSANAVANDILPDTIEIDAVVTLSEGETIEYGIDVIGGD